MARYNKKSAYRQGHTQSSASTWTILCILILVAFAAALVSFSPFGEKLQGKAVTWIESMIHGNTSVEHKAEQVFAAATSLPTPEPTVEPQKIEVLYIEAVPFYMVQMGNYTKQEDAVIVSAQNQAMGGAGYIWERKNAFRLMAAAYTDAESLKLVQRQIREDGYVNEAYITDSRTVQVTLNGDPEAIDLFKIAITVLSDCPMQLCEWTIKYDRKEMEREEIASKLKGMKQNIDEIISDLQSIESKDIEQVCTVLGKYENAISTFLKSHDSIKQDYYTGSLRHLQLELIDVYSQFFEE